MRTRKRTDEAPTLPSSRTSLVARTLVLALAVAILPSSSRAIIGPSPALFSHDKEIAVEVGTGTRNVNFAGTVGGSTINPTKLKMAENSYGLRLSYGLTDNFTPYALLGFSKVNVGLINLSAGGVSQGGLNMNGDLGFLWGLGANFHVRTLAWAPDLALGLSAEYRNFSSDINAGSVDVDEFRLALKGSRTFDKATLYGGPVYSTFRSIYAGNTTIGVRSAGTIHSKNDFGLFAGADYAFNERINGRLELEFISAIMINLSVTYHIGGPWLTREKTVAPPPPEPVVPVARGPEGAEARAYTPSGQEVAVGAEASPPSPERRIKPAEPPPEAAPRETRSTRDMPSEASERRAFEEKSAEELVALGNEQTALGRFDEAISNYRRAVAADPGNFRARYNLATAQYLNHDYSGAKLSFEESIKLMPRDAQAHLFLGFCYYRMGQIDGAVRAWQRVLELDPDNAVALNNLQALGR